MVLLSPEDIMTTIIVLTYDLILPAVNDIINNPAKVGNNESITLEEKYNVCVMDQVDN